MYSLFVRNELHFRGPDLSEILSHAVWDLHALVPKHARDFLFLHAGAVGRDGRALVLPAKMDSGKSSLVTALLGNGWSYLSDELGALDPVTGKIYPFPKLISLDEASMSFFPALALSLGDRDRPGESEWFVSPEDMGSTVGQPEAPGWIVFPTSDWEGDARLTPVASAAAVERMAENCFNLYRYADRGVVMLSRAAAGAETFELRGGTPSERAELLTEQLT